MESGDSFGLPPNELPYIPEEMLTIPMPRQNHCRLSRSRPSRSAPPTTQPPVAPGPSPASAASTDNPNNDATNQDDRYNAPY